MTALDLPWVYGEWMPVQAARADPILASVVADFLVELAADEALDVIDLVEESSIEERLVDLAATTADLEEARDELLVSGVGARAAAERWAEQSTPGRRRHATTIELTADGPAGETRQRALGGAEHEEARRLAAAWHDHTEHRAGRTP